MYVVHTTIPLDPDCGDELVDRVDDLVERSRNEDGTVRYRAMRDLTEGNLLRFFEQYEDADAAEAHTNSEEYRRFNELLPEVVDGKIETLQFETDEVHAVEFTAADAVDALE
ncbi:antibiotic biosynthesis monooxygenase [Halovenus sp. WSH3]|uniref:Antibiotic biosynthesis monooxygenase n=1 Tax=Halovenus carboxidivorans TaxID=2692199 RepID=A0A6B0TDA2_9EURY|nr:putative quinol monooxygenase [Halovenus carboxidivorans]MXR52900.1 antibiotic biosynthesis monooxygenase [Halovenus carboxidivorans]